jgi:hypothetical protein
MIGCPSKMVPIGFEFPLGGFMKGHHPFPSYLPIFIFFLLIHPIHWFEHWVGQTSRGLYLTLWEEGAKFPEVKSSWKKIKSKITKPSYASLRISKKSIKGFSARNIGTRKNNKSRPSRRIGGLITSQPIRSMGM